MMPRGGYGSRVHVQSLGFRTDLALLRLGGSTVEDRGSYVVVRTPTNPSFYWGNFLLLPAPPAPGQVPSWLDAFRREFPDARHAAFGIDRPRPGDLAGLRSAGLRVDVAVAMTATAAHPPPHPNLAAELRMLDGDDDWGQQVELSLLGEDGPHVTREFSETRDRAHRAVVEAGHGAWWGGFIGGRLVASLGIFRAGPGLARFQHVKTHPDQRGRGLAGSLVHAAGRHAFDELGAHRLVMVADPGYVAMRVYRSVGFVDGDPHVEATLLPGPD